MGGRVWVCVGVCRSWVLLEEGDKYSVSEDGAEMTIRAVRKLDEGEYTCIASNKSGKSDPELSLRVCGETHTHTTTTAHHTQRRTHTHTHTPTPPHGHCMSFFKPSTECVHVCIL